MAAAIQYHYKRGKRYRYGHPRLRCGRTPIRTVCVRYAYVILPYTLTSLYDEYQLRVSYTYNNQTSQKSTLNVSLTLANANNNKKAVLSQR